MRFDSPEGFVITDCGKPIQAGRRIPDSRYGNCDMEYWLRSVDGPPGQVMLGFLIATFKTDLDAEWNKYHGLISRQ